jgi:hypothetical protein
MVRFFWGRPERRADAISAWRAALGLAASLLVLLSPFRSGAAHIVQLGSVPIEETDSQPTPSLGGHIESARRRQQHSQDVRMRKSAHFESPLDERFSDTALRWVRARHLCNQRKRVETDSSILQRFIRPVELVCCLHTWVCLQHPIGTSTRLLLALMLWKCCGLVILRKHPCFRAQWRR